MARLEIAVTNQDDARNAESGGADSMEISADLSVGGLTPSLPLVDQILNATKIDVHVIIRPHAESFVYSPADVEVILRDTKAFAKLGIKSIVFGAWDAERRLDLELIKRVQEAASPAQITVHRALDESLEPERSLEALQKLGVRRVLTAGPAANAWDGRVGLARWVKNFGKQISFVVSGSLKLEQISQMKKEVNAQEYHFGAAARTNGVVDVSKVRRLRDAVV